ncbi:hypothetical protein THH46_18390 [Pseudomonas sp. NA13]
MNGSQGRSAVCCANCDNARSASLANITTSKPAAVAAVHNVTRVRQRMELKRRCIRVNGLITGLYPVDVQNVYWAKPNLIRNAFQVCGGTGAELARDGSGAFNFNAA